MSDKLVRDAGAWTGDLDQLAATWLSGEGSDTDLPETVRFLLAVRRLSLAREREPDCEFDRPAAMVLVPPAFFESPPAGTRRSPLLNNGNYRLTGQVHFLNVAAAGRSMDYQGDEGDLFDALETCQVQGLPTVVYAPKAGGHSKLSWYPNGIKEDTKVSVIPVAVEEPTVELITQAIEGVYRGDLITPDCVPEHDSLWEKAANGWASEVAEARVQRNIKLGLHGRFPTCRIVAEQPGPDGRTDIEIVGDFGVAPGAVMNFAVLELKVLREKGSTGSAYAPKKIAKHIDDGVDQAFTYGGDRNFRERLLCCFDMRAEELGATNVFAPIQTKADQLGVSLRYWFLYRSSKHYRQCQAAAGVKAG
ncbi:hypothetical protein [Pseudoxanthomonas mexicana]